MNPDFKGSYHRHPSRNEGLREVQTYKKVNQTHPAFKKGKKRK